MQPVLRVSNLRVTFRTDEGPAKILDDVSLEVGPGRVLGVVGESGCGKSTLIRTVMGILPPTARVEAGQVMFEGEDLLAFSEAELNRDVRSRRIGFIPQDPYLALNPVFTVGAQLLEIMRTHAPADGTTGRTRRRGHVARLVALLDRMQVPDPADALHRYPHQFSGGQRQRMVIAAALACAPRLVIADEPTTALDVTTQHGILFLLRELVAEFGVSLLFVTHDLGVVSALCDEVSVIYAGQTVESGPVAHVLAAPSHPYTRALLACHPDRGNMSPGALGGAFAGIPGSVPSPLAPPSGCRYAPRCDVARPACSQRPSHLVPATAGTLANCVLYE